MIMGETKIISTINLEEKFQKIICPYVEKLIQAEKENFDSVIVLIASEKIGEPLYEYMISKFVNGLLNIAEGALLGAFYEVETRKWSEDYLKFNEQVVKVETDNRVIEYQIEEFYMFPVSDEDVNTIIRDESYHNNGIIIVDTIENRVEFIDTTMENIENHLDENKKYWYCFKILNKL